MKRMKHLANRCIALNVASLRRCVSQKIFAQQHGQTAWRGSKKKVSRNGATTQRKRLNPPAKANIQRQSVARLRFFNAHTERLGVRGDFFGLGG